MAQVIFLLGRPGSGKSQVARSLKGDEQWAAYQVARPFFLEGWSVLHISDYAFLQKRYINEVLTRSKPAQFRANGIGGFDVLDFTVLPLALRQVNAWVSLRRHAWKTLILIEFARQEYDSPTVWNHFSDKVLRDASFLYLHADLERCMRRVARRAANRFYPDDQYVSEGIMRGYYGYAQETQPLAGLQQRFGNERVMAVDTNGRWRETWAAVEYFLRTVSARSLTLAQPQEIKPRLPHLAAAGRALAPLVV